MHAALLLCRFGTMYVHSFRCLSHYKRLYNVCAFTNYIFANFLSW